MLPFEPILAPARLATALKPLSPWRAGLLLALWLAVRLGTTDGAPATPVLQTPAGWSDTCIYCPHFVDRMSARSAVMNANGRLRVAYGGDSLYFGQESGDGAWQVEVVDPGPGAGLDAALAMDAHNRPHILYDARDVLKHAWYDGLAWHIDPLPGDAVSAYPQPVIMGAADGRLHALFRDRSLQALIYAIWDSGVWQATVVEQGIYFGYQAGLALDDQGRPHVVYQAALPRNLVYAWFDGLVWQELVFNGPGEDGYDPSLALDADGEPHIVFRGDLNDDYHEELLYRYRDGENWHLAVIDDPVADPDDWALHTGFFNSLVIDGQGRLQVGYAGLEHQSLPWVTWYGWRYAYLDQGGWQVEQQHSEGAHTGLVVDQLNRPTVVVKRDGGLARVSRDGSAWQTTMLDEGAAPGEFDIALVAASGGRFQAAFPDLERLVVGHAAGLAGQENWLVTVVDDQPVANWQSWVRLAGGPAGQPHLLYRAGHYYATFDGQHWLTETIGSNYAHLAYDLAVDRWNRPHAAASIDPEYYPFSALLYWTRDGVWSAPEMVDDITDAYHLSIAVDAGGRPHLAYSGDGLRYAVRKAAGWTRTTILPNLTVAGLDLALDRLGRPHIAYRADVNQSNEWWLGYAYFDGATWHDVIVDQTGSFGRPALEVAGHDLVHIGYLDASDGSLKYAYGNLQGWEITTLATIAGESGPQDLALFGNLPAVAYYDPLGRDLRLIYRPFAPTDHVYLPLAARLP
jgi:hypothetical protein